MTKLLSPQGYAAHRKNVTRQAVMRAIASGRLKASLSKTDKGWWRIDPELADREWKAWTDPTKVPTNKAGGRPPKTGDLFDAEEREGAISHARASAARIRVDMELKQLELAERRALLIDRAGVERGAFTMARELREVLGKLPDRISADLHGATSILDVHRMLTEEIAHALDALTASKEFQSLTNGREHESP